MEATNVLVGSAHGCVELCEALQDNVNARWPGGMRTHNQVRG